MTELLARCPAELRAGVQAIGFQALRWQGSALAARKLIAPKDPPPAVEALLIVALALLWPQQRAPYADHTLVDQAVAAAKRRTPAAAAFVNAVLRRFVRERAAIVEAVRHQPVAAFNHPLWWIERVKQDWPREWQALLLAANEHPPMTLRVNSRRTTAPDYLRRLAALGRDAAVIAPHALELHRPCPVAELPGWNEGEVSVQDLSAQAAAPLLLEGLAAGARVLDACAAPGGKTAHLLELADLDLLALDNDSLRLARVQDNLNRLRLPTSGAVELKAADAREVSRWWDGRPFDAVLLDAPCTASGIVRRHPDVRWLRRPDDLVALARLQAELLDSLWPLVKPGGRLLYATCSIFRAEGPQQIDAFLQRHGATGAELDPRAPGYLLPLPDNSQRADADLPDRRTGDGFYYALIRKP
jgi:16S rRNA (cytosine967-C5)-methyltransferase